MGTSRSACVEPKFTPCRTDATFLDSSTIYRATNEISDFYDDEELNQFGLPFGFFYRQSSSSAHVQGFPIVFDVNLNVSRYKDMMELLRSGAYLDLKTRRLDFKMVLLNTETGYIALVRDVAQRVDGGGLLNNWGISIVDALLYEDGSDYVRLALEVSYAIALLYSLVAEVREVFVGTNNRCSAAAKYLGDWRNWVDIVAFATQIALMFTWVSHAILCSKLTVQTHARVYADFYAVGRIPQAGPGLEDTFKMYSDIQSVVNSFNVYQTLVAAAIFFSILQFLKTREPASPASLAPRLCSQAPLSQQTGLDDIDHFHGGRGSRFLRLSFSLHPGPLRRARTSPLWRGCAPPRSPQVETVGAQKSPTLETSASP